MQLSYSQSLLTCMLCKLISDKMVKHEWTIASKQTSSKMRQRQKNLIIDYITLAVGKFDDSTKKWKRTYRKCGTWLMNGLLWAISHQFHLDLDEELNLEGLSIDIYLSMLLFSHSFSLWVKTMNIIMNIKTPNWQYTIKK